MLSDDNKRAIYDKYGEAGLKGDAFGGMGGMGGFQGANPMDIFESFFGGGGGGFPFGMDGMGGRGGMRERAGENEQYELQIDFLDAVFGCKKELEITHLTGGWRVLSEFPPCPIRRAAVLNWAAVSSWTLLQEPSSTLAIG